MCVARCLLLVGVCGVLFVVACGLHCAAMLAYRWLYAVVCWLLFVVCCVLCVVLVVVDCSLCVVCCFVCVIYCCVLYVVSY